MRTATLARPQRFVPTGKPGPLSQSIIFAEPGRFYAYSSDLMEIKPLFALLDCKANKARTLAQATELGPQVHLHFKFDGTHLAQVFSIKASHAAGWLGQIKDNFDDVWIGRASIEVGDFYTLIDAQDSTKLMDVCMASCHEHRTSMNVAPGMIFSVMTGDRKYCLFLVKNVEPHSVSIEACHVWLPEGH
ncbi:MAG: hypothetical protein V4481_01420 [Patescibacteria group bacterium]